MPMDVYEKLLDDLKSANYVSRLHLYLMAEPLCDPRITDLIGMARERFPENAIFITSNGDALNGPESLKRLFDAGLTTLLISDYDKNGKLDYASVHPRVAILSKEQLEKDYYNRGGHVDVNSANQYDMCTWVFDKAYINYRGDVILCCSDYEYSVVFGNIMDQHIIEIYSSEKYRQYRKAHIRGDGKKMPLCNHCNRIAGLKSSNRSTMEARLTQASHEQYMQAVSQR